MYRVEVEGDEVKAQMLYAEHRVEAASDRKEVGRRPGRAARRREASQAARSAMCLSSISCSCVSSLGPERGVRGMISTCTRALGYTSYATTQRSVSIRTRSG